jgi:ATP-dependent exoDNAse (exonuclease V) alpha subunit
MMHDYNLDMVDRAMQIIRENREPFGGLQIILCGDFFQLPPVMQGGNGKFVTESEAWAKANLSVCYLEEQHRAEDIRLQEILNSMREGTLQQKHVDWLKSRMGHTALDNVTRLYTVNIDVENINNAKLAKLKGDTHYFLRTSGGRSYNDLLKLQRNVLAPEILKLKEHAVVMAVKNDPELRYANGSIGVIDGFDYEGFPIVDFGNRYPVTVYPDLWEYKKNDRVTASITQIPLRLAYAITVHKSQGMTLDAAEIDLSNAFVEGMGYVALSRVKNLESLYLKGLNRMALAVSRKARSIDKQLREASRRIA